MQLIFFSKNHKIIVLGSLNLYIFLFAIFSYFSKIQCSIATFSCCFYWLNRGRVAAAQKILIKLEQRIMGSDSTLLWKDFYFEKEHD